MVWGSWRGFGFFVEDFYVFGGSAFPEVDAGDAFEAEVVEDFPDDFFDVAGGEFVVEFVGVDAVEEFFAEGFGAGAFGSAVDSVFDAADDFPAGVGSGLGREFGRVEGLGLRDRAADGAADAVEGDREGFAGLGWFAGLDYFCVDGFGDVGAHGDELVEDFAVEGVVFGLARVGVELVAWGYRYYILTMGSRGKRKRITGTRTFVG